MRLFPSRLLRRPAHRSGLRPAARVDAGGQARLPARRPRFPADQLDRALRQRRLAVRYPDRLPHVGLASRTGRQGGVEGRLPRRPARRSVARRSGSSMAGRSITSSAPIATASAKAPGYYKWNDTVSFEGSYANDVPQGRGTLRIDDVVLSGEVEQGLSRHGRQGRGDRRAAPIVRAGRQAHTEGGRPLVSIHSLMSGPGGPLSGKKPRASAPESRPGPRPRSGRRG